MNEPPVEALLPRLSDADTDHDQVPTRSERLAAVTWMVPVHPPTLDGGDIAVEPL